MGFRGKRQYSDVRSQSLCKKLLRSNSGQSVILVSMLIVSFLMFFSFTINTGLLISAKISVQTAADAAAYAGAAAQARLLNSISFLNYDMRRQYKRYLFRTNMVGAIGSPNYPTPLDPKSGIYDFPKMDAKASPQNNGKTAFKVPMVCIPLTTAGTRDDNCLKVNIKDTTKMVRDILGTGGPPSIQELVKFYERIDLNQLSLCRGQGAMNFNVLTSWLFRGDNDTAYLDQILAAMVEHNASFRQNDADQVKNTINPLIRGMGLFPRNLINLMRIETLVDFLNSKGQQDVTDFTQDQIDALENGTNAEAAEKTIQAFKSAASNLNTSVFDTSLTSITELQSKEMIRIKPLLVSFNAYIQMMLEGSGGQGGGTICNAAAFRFPIVNAPVGVTIDSLMKVSYGVKIKAYVKPRGLLFLPGSDPLELDAVAGAKPFGSRVAPKNFPGHLVVAQKPTDLNGVSFNDGTGAAGYNIPDLDVGGNATTRSVVYLQELVNHAKQNGQINLNGLLEAERAAMAPTPEEVGRYNILPPPPQSAEESKNYSTEFINYNNATDPANAAKPVYRFYAPIFPKGGGDVNKKIDDFMQQIFVQTEVGKNDFGISMKDVGDQASKTLKTYIANRLPRGAELGETTTLASIELPMSGINPPRAGKPFWLTRSTEVLSSWAPSFVRTSSGSSDAAFAFKPRFGYSVRFVNLQDLSQEWGGDPDGELSKTNH